MTGGLLLEISSAVLPWNSIFAEKTDEYTHITVAKQSEIERCLSCPYAQCVDCVCKKESAGKVGRPHTDYEEIRRFAARGFSNLQISTILGVSERTVLWAKKEGN